jgi:hypothetical protein
VRPESQGSLARARTALLGEETTPAADWIDGWLAGPAAGPAGVGWTCAADSR